MPRADRILLHPCFHQQQYVEKQYEPIQPWLPNSALDVVTYLVLAEKAHEMHKHDTGHFLPTPLEGRSLGTLSLPLVREVSVPKVCPG